MNFSRIPSLVHTTEPQVRYFCRPTILISVIRLYVRGNHRHRASCTQRIFIASEVLKFIEVSHIHRVIGNRGLHKILIRRENLLKISAVNSPNYRIRAVLYRYVIKQCHYIHFKNSIDSNKEFGVLGKPGYIRLSYFIKMKRANILVIDWIL